MADKSQHNIQIQLLEISLLVKQKMATEPLARDPTFHRRHFPILLIRSHLTLPPALVLVFLPF